MSSFRLLPCRSRNAQVALFLAALTPFMLSWVARAVGPAMRVVPHVVRPALVFDQYLVNLGNVESRREYSARFAFVNRGDHPVEITELKPSCGCLNPRLAKRHYEPGESGDFSLRIQTANEEPGQKEYYCKVVYEDPVPREMDVTFKITLPKRTVTVRPRSLIFYSPGDALITKEIVITDNRKRKLTLIDAECSLAFVTVTMEQTVRVEAGHRLHSVIVKTEQVPSGRHRGLIMIRTDDPDFPRIEVPLWVERVGSPESERKVSLDPSFSH